MLDISNIGGYIDLETYVTLETVNPDNFLEKNIPILHPSSLEYKQY
jgi:hypothetical protein